MHRTHILTLSLAAMGLVTACKGAEAGSIDQTSAALSTSTSDPAAATDCLTSYVSCVRADGGAGCRDTAVACWNALQTTTTTDGGHAGAAKNCDTTKTGTASTREAGTTASITLDALATACVD